jgi:hypothetical protein
VLRPGLFRLDNTRTCYSCPLMLESYSLSENNGKLCSRVTETRNRNCIGVHLTNRTNSPLSAASLDHPIPSTPRAASIAHRTPNGTASLPTTQPAAAAPPPSEALQNQKRVTKSDTLWCDIVLTQILSNTDTVKGTFKAVPNWSVRERNSRGFSLLNEEPASVVIIH